MHRQIRHFSKSIICLVCGTLITLSPPAAFATGKKKSRSPLSSYGLTQEKFEDEAKEYLGIPYRRGGDSTRGIDCSGFARMIYERLFGIDLPHNSRDQFHSSDLKKVAPGDLQPGDLIFFGNKKKRVNHVGVYLSDGQFIHASTSQGVIVSSLDTNYWRKRLVGSKRHLALTPGTATGTEQVRFEGSVAIPVHEKGTLTGFTRSDLQTIPSEPMQVDFNTMPGDYRILDPGRPRLSMYAVGYDHTLTTGLNMNFTALSETFNNSTTIPGFDGYTRGFSLARDDDRYETGVRKGVKLSSSFQPSGWLMIKPSITYFDYALEDSQANLFDTPRRTLGLNTILSPEHSHWSLSMLLQYSDRNALVSPESDILQSRLNMGVKLGISLSDSMQFSIIGKHDRRTFTEGTADDALSTEKTNSDIFLSFDLIY